MIYLDHHATTPLSDAVRAAMRSFIDGPLFNPSSIHRGGRKTRSLIENARHAIARQCGAQAKELVFTSGGTEALHLCVRSAALTIDAKTILLDPGAHPALAAACHRTAQRTGAVVHRLTADFAGRTDVNALADALRAHPGPALIALTWVQHETGTITPLRAIADVARAHNAEIVIDAVQAFGKIPVDFGPCGASAAAISAHKIGGPTGIGAAWIRADQRARALIDGGGQERGVRAGTENALGILAFGVAAGELDARLASMPAVGALRDRLESAVRELPGFSQTVRDVERVSTAAHFLIDGVPGEEVVAALDLDGICTSAGPACSSGRSGASESLLAMFGDRVKRAGSLRISLGPSNTADEIEQCSTALRAIAERLQSTRA